MLCSEAGNQSIRLLKRLVSRALEHYLNHGQTCLVKSVFQEKYQPKEHVFISRQDCAQI